MAHTKSGQAATTKKKNVVYEAMHFLAPTLDLTPNVRVSNLVSIDSWICIATAGILPTDLAVGRDKIILEVFPDFNRVISCSAGIRSIQWPQSTFARHQSLTPSPGNNTSIHFIVEIGRVRVHSISRHQKIMQHANCHNNVCHFLWFEFHRFEKNTKTGSAYAKHVLDDSAGARKAIIEDSLIHVLFSKGIGLHDIWLDRESIVGNNYIW